MFKLNILPSLPPPPQLWLYWSTTTTNTIGVTYGGYGGYAYPPLFGVGRVIEKITATFPHPALT